MSRYKHSSGPWEHAPRKHNPGPSNAAIMIGLGLFMAAAIGVASLVWSLIV